MNYVAPRKKLKRDGDSGRNVSVDVLVSGDGRREWSVLGAVGPSSAWRQRDGGVTVLTQMYYILHGIS